MKKLIIAVAAIAMGFAAEAASIKWATGALYAPVDADGTKGSGTDPKAVGANLFVFSINKKTYDDWAAMSYAAASEDIYKTYSSQLTEGNIKATTAAMGTATWEEKGLSETETTYYAATIITYKDGDNKEWYIANVGTATASGSGSTNAGMLGTTFNSTGGGTTKINAWSSVPEPTSGLLLLLGVAGLALRRRRA